MRAVEDEPCPEVRHRVAAVRREALDGLLAERAYRELRDRIVTLRLPPGEMLHEGELMRELGVGRTPLR